MMERDHMDGGGGDKVIRVKRKSPDDTAHEVAEKLKRVRKNEFMHVRNKYRHSPPNFKALAEVDCNLRPFVKVDSKGIGHIDWKDVTAQKAITKSLLLHDFNVKWDIPCDYLIPPVPVRANYIHWIEDVLHDYCGILHTSREEEIRGVDVGTGANVIYPLLGVAINNHWRFIGTDINKDALGIAAGIISLNGLEDKVQLRLTDRGSPPLSAALAREGEEKQIHFSMCNPPFYAHADEAVACPTSDSSGVMSELVTPGGEVSFVSSMIIDSLTLRTRVLVYTTMLGKRSSLRPLIKLLKSNKITNYSTTEFCQGSTSRWGLAWSFLPSPSVDKIRQAKKDEKKRTWEQWTLPIAAGISIREAYSRVKSYFVTPKWHVREDGGSFGDDTVITGGDAFPVAATTAHAEVTGYAAGESELVIGDDDYESMAPIFSFTLTITAERESIDYIIKYTGGSDRGAFWRYVDELRGNVLRNNRRWRRQGWNKGKET